MPLCGLIITSVIIWSFYTCGQSDVPPAPELLQVNSGVSKTVVLRCQAPSGYHGRVYQLYRLRTLVDSVKFLKNEEFAEFTVKEVAVDDENYYCCQYQNSAFSSYIKPRTVQSPPTSLAVPQLSVAPSHEQIRPGQMMTFHCQAPPPNQPVVFILQRKVSGVIQEVMRSVKPLFSVEVKGWTEGGVYTCVYQNHLSEISPPSSPVSVVIAVDLPVPLLSQEKEGSLVCTGSPSYPGAHFSLFQQGSLSPIAVLQVPMIKHSAQFAVPAQTVGGTRYQCGYSVLMGGHWAHSERSAPMSLSYNTEPSHSGSMDLALVVGSASAVLLFLMMLILLGVVIYKHVKAGAEKRRQREQNQFWQEVHSRDHIVDLTLQRINTDPKNTGLGSRRSSNSEPIYDSPMTSFLTVK